MSHELLRTWLKLPSTPWPPDHYTLLGLALGQGTIDDIEQRVLERMDLLRRYQLSHPDVVTEGMNRLAQAMVCLTESAPRQGYDRKLGVDSGSAATSSSAPASTDRRQPSGDVPEVPVLLLPPPLPPSSAPTVVNEGGFPEKGTVLRTTPPNQEPEVYTLDPEDSRELPVRGRRNDEPISEDEDRYLPLADEDEPIEAELLDAEEDSEEPRERYFGDMRFEAAEARRRMYAELARIRRVLVIWKEARGYLADPQTAFTRRTHIVAFMACLADLRAALPSVDDLIGGPDQPGHLIAVLARQNLIVETFRSLLPSQRDALAQDLRAGHFRLEDRYEEIRQQIRRMTRKRLLRRICQPIRRRLTGSMEWVLILLGAAALVIALIRSLPLAGRSL